MNIKFQYLILIIIATLSLGCTESTLFSNQAEDIFWLKHKGAEMPIWVEGNTASKQFILVLHGGPAGSGSLGYNLNHEFSVPLEERYALAYWDQRGSGNAKGNPSISTLTLDQFVEDLDLVVDAMKHRYGTDIDIFLLGNSWGGFLGNAFLSHYEKQDKICGWIVVDGQHDFRQGLVYAHQQMLDIAEERISAGVNPHYWNTKKESILSRPVDSPVSEDYAFYNRIAYQIEYQLEREDVLSQEFFLEDGQGFDYYFQSSYNPITSNANANTTNSILWNEIIQTSLSDELHQITLPTLILWGKYDTVTPTSLAYDLFEYISTKENEKKLVILQSAGHQALKHEPRRVVEEVISFISEHGCNI